MSGVKIAKSKIIAALKASMGNVSMAAKQLKCERSGLHRRINADNDLKQLLIDCRESMVDNAESSLNRAILQGEAWAVCFFLKTQGKSRGYVERSEIKAETKVAIVSNPEELTDEQLTVIATGSSQLITETKASQKEPD